MCFILSRSYALTQSTDINLSINKDLTLANSASPSYHYKLMTPSLSLAIIKIRDKSVSYTLSFYLLFYRLSVSISHVKEPQQEEINPDAKSTQSFR